MVVKKKTLIIVCIIIAVGAIFGTIATVKYVKQLNAEREKIVQKERFDRAVDREYKQLVREYENIVETINDYSYSWSFRYEYVKKLNELLAAEVYPINYDSGFYTVSVCVDSLRHNKNRDLEMLKLKAAFNALLGD